MAVQWTPAVGTIAVGLALSSTLDTAKATINIDLSSWMANHFGMDYQNMGSANATDTWNSITEPYTFSWSAMLTQGQQAGNYVTWTLTGSASTVPAPATLLLIVLGLVGVFASPRRQK